MKQPATSSARSFTDIPIIITEISEVSPTRDSVVSLSLPSTGKKGRQQTTIESTNHHRLSPRLYPTKQQPHTSQNNTDELYKVRSETVCSSAHSLAEEKLEEIIEDLNENPVEKEAFEEKNTWATSSSKWINQSRRFIRHIMEQAKFHYGIIVLVIVDLIIVFIELTIEQLSAPCLTEQEMEQYNTTQQRDDCLIRPSQQLDDGELALYFISLVIICIFVLEILSAFYAFGWRRYTKILFLLDAIIVLTSFILEVYFHFGNALKAGRASAALVVLRMWKVVRAIHAIAHSISLRNHMIVEKIKEAETTLQEEIAEAEKTILEQKNKINDLTNLLEKTGTQTNPEQIDGFTRKRTKSFNSVTRF